MELKDPTGRRRHGQESSRLQHRGHAGSHPQAERGWSSPSGCGVECTLRIDQDIGDVLDVADFPFAFAHFKQWIVAGTLGISWVEQQAMRELRPEASRQLPVLALDIVDDGGVWPGQKRRDDKTHTFARTGRGEGQNMLWSIMAEIVSPSLPRNTP